MYKYIHIYVLYLTLRVHIYSTIPNICENSTIHKFSSGVSWSYGRRTLIVPVIDLGLKAEGNAALVSCAATSTQLIVFS